MFKSWGAHSADLTGSRFVVPTRVAQRAAVDRWRDAGIVDVVCQVQVNGRQIVNFI